MVELEPIGPREILAPGTSGSFTEEWWLAPLTVPAADESLDVKAMNSVLESLRQ